MDQTEVSSRQSAPLRLRIDSKLWKGELSSLSPELDSCLDLRRPQQIWLLRRLRGVGNQSRRTVHVVTTDLMLGTITAGSMLAFGRP